MEKKWAEILPAQTLYCEVESKATEDGYVLINISWFKISKKT